MFYTQTLTSCMKGKTRREFKSDLLCIVVLNHTVSQYNMKYFVVSLLLSVVIMELVSAQYGGFGGFGGFAKRAIEATKKHDAQAYGRPRFGRSIEDTKNHDPLPYGWPGRSIEDTKKRDPQGYGKPISGGGNSVGGG